MGAFAATAVCLLVTAVASVVSRATGGDGSDPTGTSSNRDEYGGVAFQASGYNCDCSCNCPEVPKCDDVDNIAQSPGSSAGAGNVAPPALDVAAAEPAATTTTAPPTACSPLVKMTLNWTNNPATRDIDINLIIGGRSDWLGNNARANAYGGTFRVWRDDMGTTKIEGATMSTTGSWADPSPVGVMLNFVSGDDLSGVFLELEQADGRTCAFPVPDSAAAPSAADNFLMGCVNVDTGCCDFLAVMERIRTDARATAITRSMCNVPEEDPSDDIDVRSLFEEEETETEAETGSNQGQKRSIDRAKAEANQHVNSGTSKNNNNHNNPN